MKRRQRAEQAGIADERVETAPSSEDGLAEPVDGGVIAQIAGNQRRRTLLARAQGANFVVKLLERALRARQSDDMRARFGKSHGDRAADAARGAGDEGDPALIIHVFNTITLFEWANRLAIAAIFQQGAVRFYRNFSRKPIDPVSIPPRYALRYRPPLVAGPD